jgi:hypothetical protein
MMDHWFYFPFIALCLSSIGWTVCHANAQPHSWRRPGPHPIRQMAGEVQYRWEVGETICWRVMILSAIASALMLAFSGLVYLVFRSL